MHDNYDEEVADGLTEDTNFDLFAVIEGIKYFNFKKHQSKHVMLNWIKSGTGKAIHKDTWKVAFRLKK